ncbi:MAG TPA: Eco57I restriction-modification methylase domain-containing protein, partial [Spirochaetota bacterium]|nr:Eco57I restriction-modification methylase domain-containing protein [Spirochaetota bacterium]
MDREQAKNLITEVFTNRFSENTFKKFIVNLLNLPKDNLIYTDEKDVIPNAFKDHINYYKRIGQYTDDNGADLDILIVNLKKEKGLNQARTTQRDFVADYLKNSVNKDYCLVAYFYDDIPDWRFSFVKITYQIFRDEKDKVKIKEQKNPPKRYSFLVGENEPNHTAQEFLLPILIDDRNNPSLESIEKAFNVESVTKEFFKCYKDLLLDVNDAVSNALDKKPELAEHFKEKGINPIDFSKKLLGQIVFIYFLQKKGWLGVPLDKNWGEGERNFLRDLFIKKPHNNFFNDILEPLFYEALAIDRGEKAVYKKFDCRIPFLNGGLFEPYNNYDWKNVEIILPDELFSNNIATKQGDIGTGIFDVLDRYNFTVSEDEPLEKEVAVDPEMLGKVFENLLEVKDRKSKGTFYTPREIVHYMCRESLRNSLLNHFNNIHILFENKNSDQILEKYSAEGLIKIKEKILELKIVDPACGSGAFLLGMLNEVLNLIGVIDNIVNDKKEFYEEKIKTGDKITYNPTDGFNVECLYLGDCKFKVLINKEEKGVFISTTDNHELSNVIKQYVNDYNKVHDKKTVANLFSQGKIEGKKTFNAIRGEKNLRYIVDDKGNKIWYYSDYDTTGKYRKWREATDDPQLYIYKLKKKLIEDCIYGVDIDPGATDIAKLRLWLSLVVEYEGDKIEPLPNLDYKIVCGNSLLGIEVDLFNEKYLRDIEDKKHEFFKETNHDKKLKLKEDINKLIKIVTNNDEHFDFKIYFSEVFHAGRDGFDVVIGNPPYVRQEEIKYLKDDLKKLRYEVFNSTSDIYTYFYEKGHNLLQNKGILTFITSNKWMRAKYGEKLRIFFKNKSQMLQLIDFGEAKIFDAIT